MIAMKRIFCFALVVCLFLTSCTFHDVYYDMAICGFYAVPEITAWDLKGGAYECRELEKDTYGRRLFEASFESVLTLEPKTALIIMQKYDSKYVYYYEDISYTLHCIEDTDVDTFKALNDWEQPLNEAKMSRRRAILSLGLTVGYSSMHDFGDVEKACETALDGIITAKSDHHMPTVLVDEDGAGHDLYYFRIGREGGMEDYFVIVNEELELAFLQIEDEIFDPEAFVAFKQENGWQYGYTQ